MSIIAPCKYSLKNVNRQKNPPPFCRADGNTCENSIVRIRLIHHGHEMQSFCRKRFARSFAVAALKNRANVVGRQFADADVQKRACDYAHHIVQKAVARDGYAKFAIKDCAVGDSFFIALF